VSQIGYFGVIVPDKDFWQCFYIDDSFRDSAHDALRTVRSSRTLATGSKVISRLEIPEADQGVLGNFCAMLVEAALAASGQMTQTRIAHPEAVLGNASYAVREIIDRPYFWIEGRFTEGGTYTTIQPIYVSSIAQARTYIDKMPQVRQIKRRLLSKVQEVGPHREGQHRSASMRSAKRWPAIDQMVNQINTETSRRKR
jgi:hypothetical protein